MFWRKKTEEQIVQIQNELSYCKYMKDYSDTIVRIQKSFNNAIQDELQEQIDKLKLEVWSLKNHSKYKDGTFETKTSHITTSISGIEKDEQNDKYEYKYTVISVNKKTHIPKVYPMYNENQVDELVKSENSINNKNK